MQAQAQQTSVRTRPAQASAMEEAKTQVTNLQRAFETMTQGMPMLTQQLSEMREQLQVQRTLLTRRSACAGAMDAHTHALQHARDDALGSVEEAHAAVVECTAIAGVLHEKRTQLQDLALDAYEKLSDALLTPLSSLKLTAARLVETEQRTAAAALAAEERLHPVCVCVRTATDTARSLEAAVNELDEELTQLALAREHLQSELERAIREREANEAAYTAMEGTLAGLHRNAFELERREADMATAHERELAGWQCQVEGLQIERRDALRELEHAQTQHAKVELAVTQHRAEENALKGAVDQLQQQHDDKQSLVARLETKLAAETELHAKLQADIDAAAAAQSAWQHLIRLIAAHESANMTLDQELSVKQASLGSLQKRAADAQRRAEEAQRRRVGVERQAERCTQLSSEADELLHKFCEPLEEVLSHLHPLIQLTQQLANSSADSTAGWMQAANAVVTAAQEAERFRGHETGAAVPLRQLLPVVEQLLSSTANLRSASNQYKSALEAECELGASAVADGAVHERTMEVETKALDRERELKERELAELCETVQRLEAEHVLLKEELARSKETQLQQIKSGVARKVDEIRARNRRRIDALEEECAGLAAALEDFAARGRAAAASPRQSAPARIGGAASTPSSSAHSRELVLTPDDSDDVIGGAASPQSPGSFKGKRRASSSPPSKSKLPTVEKALPGSSSGITSSSTSFRASECTTPVASTRKRVTFAMDPPDVNTSTRDAGEGPVGTAPAGGSSGKLSRSRSEVLSSASAPSPMTAVWNAADWEDVTPIRTTQVRRAPAQPIREAAFGSARNAAAASKPAAAADVFDENIFS